jgi:hypothetical protein
MIPFLNGCVRGLGDKIYHLSKNITDEYGLVIKEDLEEIRNFFFPDQKLKTSITKAPYSNSPVFFDGYQEGQEFELTKGVSTPSKQEVKLLN